MNEIFISRILATTIICLLFACTGLIFALIKNEPTRLKTFLHQHAQILTLVIAISATVGSLYYSEIANFVPCDYCWYQRIAMYPITILITTSLLTKKSLNSIFLITLAILGLLISVYHYQLQIFPEQVNFCSTVVPCQSKWVEEFGFVTIPFMSASAFLAIFLLQFTKTRLDEKN
tara:strand:- start:8886 stop:9410 length:525 start_codon:yes stop_codon:yes gene_type:complete